MFVLSVKHPTSDFVNLTSSKSVELLKEFAAKYDQDLVWLTDNYNTYYSLNQKGSRFLIESIRVLT